MPTIAISSEAEWHALRDITVGGSEIACLFYTWRNSDGEEKVFHMGEIPPAGFEPVQCLSPHKTGYRLLHEKRGKILPDDISDNERVQAGTHLEPALAAWSSQIFKWNIRKVRRYHRHQKHEGWGATLDYELHEKGKSGTPVEFKNVDFMVFSNTWAVGEDGEIVMAPLHIILQLQHQIGASESDGGYIVACVGGNKLRRFSMPKHEPTQARILEAVSWFWEAVKSDATVDHLADADTASDLFAFGKDGKVEDMTAEPEMSALAERLKRYKTHEKFIGQRISFLQGRLQARMGEATRATLTGWKIAWPCIERPAKMIPARWQDEKSYRGGFTVTPVKSKG